MRVHPVAELFPMMGEEDLAELAEDIRENGLKHPIALDPKGVLLDGRNRLAACERAGADPRFVRIEDEPVAYILSSNVQRRQMSKGAIAMVRVMATDDRSAITQRELARLAGTAQDFIHKARMVKKYAPELVAAVINGASLNEAYAFAQERKRAADEEAEEEAHREEREEARRKRQEKRREEQRARLAKTVEEIGPSVPLRPLPPKPDARIEVPDTVAAGLDAGLDEQKAVLDKLIAIRRTLMGLQPAPANGVTELYVAGVYSALTHIVEAAVKLAEAHEIALGEPQSIRRLK